MREGRRRSLRALPLAVALLGSAACVEAGELALACLSPPRPLSPPAAVSVPLQLTNRGQEVLQVRLAFSLPQGVTLLAEPAAPAVFPGASETVLAVFFVSAAAPFGTQSVVARAEGDEGSVYAEATVELPVNPHVEVELTLPPGSHGRPGEEVAYRVHITNRGNALGELVLSLVSPWPAETSDRHIQLPAGASLELVLTHSVPADASPGQECPLHLSVRALSSPEAIASGSLRTTVLPPAPADVPRDLRPSLPATLHWSGRWSPEGFLAKSAWRIAGALVPGQELSFVGGLDMSASALSLRRASFAYREGGWSVGGAYHSSGLRPPYRFEFWYERRHPRQRLFYRWQQGRSALQVRLREEELDAEIVVDDSWAISLVVTGARGSRLEGGLSTSGGCLSLKLGEGGAALAAALNWGRKTSLLFRASASPGTLGVEWTLIRFGERRMASLELSWKKRDAPWEKGELELALSDEGALSLQRLYGKATGGGKGPWSWSASAELARTGRGAQRAHLWSVGVEGETKLHLGDTARINFDCAFSLPALPERAGGVRWAASFGGEARLGASREANAEVHLSSSGTELSAAFRGRHWQVLLALGPREVQVTMEAQVTVSIPWVKGKGRVEGSVRTTGRTAGAGGLVLGLAGRKAITGEDGVFRFPPMDPGEYQLKVLSLPHGACVDPAELPVVSLRAGEVTEVELWLVPPSQVSGRLITTGEARRLDGRQVGAEGGIEGALVVLTDGVRTFRANTDARGMFGFEDLCAGEWKLQIELPELVPPHRLAQERYSLRLRPGEEQHLTVRAQPAARTHRPLGARLPHRRA